MQCPYCGKTNFTMEVIGVNGKLCDLKCECKTCASTFIGLYMFVQFEEMHGTPLKEWSGK